MMRHILASSYRTVPWKNGGGTTREIADSGESPPLWRLSLATIERDGPFSDFAGYDRTIVPVSGNGIVMTIDGTPTALAPLQPFTFPGEAAVTCALVGGTTHDLNVMTRRDRFAHRVTVSSGATLALPVVSDVATLAYILAGDDAGDTLVAAANEPLHLDASRVLTALIIRITHLH